MSKLQRVTSYSLVVVALIFAVKFIVVPAVWPQPEADVIVESQMMYMGETESGEQAHMLFHQEVTYWSDLICKMIPIVLLVLDRFVRRKK